MKLVKILLACALLFNFTIHAQTLPNGVELKVGPPVKLKKKHNIDKIIGKDANGLYLMAVYGRDFTVMYYSNDLVLERQNSFELVHEKNNLNYRGSTQLGDEIYFFSTYKDKKEKTTTLYVQTLNRKTLTVGKATEIGSSSYEGYKKKQSAGFGYVVSSDSNYCVFIADLPNNKDENEKMGLLVMDRNMNEVWRKEEILLPESDRDFYRYDVKMGNNGKVYILGKIFDNSRKYEKDEINYRFEMLVYEADSEVAERFDVTLEGYFLSELNFERLSNGNFHVVGFYSENGKGQNGVFNLVIDGNTHEVINREVQEFETDFIVQHYSEKAQKKAKKKEAKGKEVQFNTMYVDELIDNGDGSTTMIGEQYRYYQTCTTDANGNTRCTYHYVYGDIIVVRFTKEGKVEWMELIPKFQHTTNDGGYYSSYAIMKLPKGELALVFNDNPKNSMYDATQKFYSWKRNPKKTEVILCKVNEDGRISRNVLFHSSNEEILARPKVHSQITDTEIIILGQKRNETKLTRITFDEYF